MNERTHGRSTLRRWLEKGDPALDGREPSPDEVAAIRHAILAVPVPRVERGPVGFRLWVAAAAVVVMLVGALILFSQTRGIVSPPRRPVGEQVVSVAGAGSRRARTVQMMTPNGTRIVWTLDPEFSLGGDNR